MKYKTEKCIILTARTVGKSPSLRFNRLWLYQQQHFQIFTCHSDCPVHSGPTERDKIVCITDIHNTCTPRPCFRPTSFTPFCNNAPYQLTPLLNLLTPFWFDAPWLAYLHFSYRNIFNLCPLFQEHNWVQNNALVHMGTKCNYREQSTVTCVG
jgi:hypothetical protein